MKNSRFIERYFDLRGNGTTVKTEVLAGLTTFVTIAYILILNPQIMADPYLIMGDADMAAKIANGVFIATCFGAALGTFLMAFYARLPFVQAPGMGLNAFFAYTIVLGMGYSYAQTLVIVFLAGIFFIIITKIGLREAIIRAIPDAVKKAITPGIGLFITIIGLKNSGIVVSNDSTLVAMADFSQWQNGNLAGMAAPLVALIGLIAICVLHSRGVKAAILLGMLVSTLVGIPLGLTSLSNVSFDIGSKFSDFFEVCFLQLDFAGLFSGKNLGETVFTVLMLVISFSLVNMFDSIGTLMGAAKQSGMVDENGDVIRMNQALMSDAIATAGGALLGTSTVTTVVESSSGIAAGGRTGLTSATTGVLFLAALILAPFAQLVPSAATAPALIFVGILMISNIKEVDFSDMTNALPAFCTVIFMPFTYSIANGVAMGLITYCCVKLLTGKASEVKPLTIIVALIFAARYAFISM